VKEKASEKLSGACTVATGARTARFVHLRWIRNVWRERQALVWLLLFLTLLSSAVAVAFPLLTKQLFDLLETAIDTHMGQDIAMAQIRRIALYFAAIGVAGLIAGIFPGVRGALNMVFDYIVRRRYFGEVINKDLRFSISFDLAMSLLG